MPIANFHFGAHRIPRRVERNPIHIAHFARGRAQLGIFADDQSIRRRDPSPPRTSAAPPQIRDPLRCPIVYRCNPSCRPINFSFGRHNFSGFRRKRPPLLAQITFDKLHVIARRHKANFLALRLLRHRKIRRRAQSRAPPLFVNSPSGKSVRASCSCVSAKRK